LQQVRKEVHIVAGRFRMVDSNAISNPTLGKHSEAQFSLSICPECVNELHPDHTARTGPAAGSAMAHSGED
jgi:hypothetical protein